MSRRLALALALGALLSACARDTGLGLDTSGLGTAEVRNVSSAPEPGRRREASLLTEGKDRRFALLVGIDDYPGRKMDLTAAAADARALYSGLKRLGFQEDQTLLLLNGKATRARILEGARWLADQTEEGATGVLFLAGHVIPVAGDVDRDGEEVDEVLIAADGQPVFDGEIARALDPARGRMWLVYATCYAEGFSDAARDGRVSTYASGEGALAYESPRFGHSYMAEFLIRRGMLEMGMTEVGELFRFARRSLAGDQGLRPLQDDRLGEPLDLSVPHHLPRDRSGTGGSRRGVREATEDGPVSSFIP